MQKRHPFTKAQRLLRPQEFRAVRSEGKRRFTKSFVVYTRPNTLGMNRLGLTVGRHVGTATKRNRLKRLIREFFRLNLGPSQSGQGDSAGAAPQGLDIVISVRRGAEIKKLKDVEAELKGLFFKDTRTS